MTIKEQTASYMELSSQSYTLFVDAMSAYNRRSLEYAKNVWEIASRPYASTAIETTVRENFDRTNQLVSLTINELQTTGQKAAEFGEKVASHSAKVQESLVHSMKGLVEAGLSNANYAKETATQSFDEMTKRLEDAAMRTTAPASAN